MPSVSRLLSPSTTWCWVWFPTLVYFLYTRYPSASVSEVTADRFQLFSEKDCAVVQSILYLANAPCDGDGAAAPSSASSSDSSNSNTTHSLVLRQPLQLLWNADDATFSESLQPHHEPILLTHSTWHHDPETGRGAILVAQGSSTGRVWRWETGGGPIPIGRTLVLDQAGCRSAACRDDDDRMTYRGVGAVTHDNGDKPALILAEWGEGRIIRLEEETGARTPLVLRVPVPSTVCGTQSEDNEKIAWQRIKSPIHMQVSQVGDLFFLDPTTPDCRVLWRRKRVGQIEPLASLAQSRRAHGWTSLPHEENRDDWHVIFSGDAVGGFLLAYDKVTALSRVLVTTSLPTAGVVILEIPLGDDDDDDDDDEEKETNTESRIVFRLQRYLPTALVPGPLVMTEKKKTIFMATTEGIAMLFPHADGDYRFAGLLRLPIMDRPRITSMTLGLDSYLYVTTESRLWRIKIQD